MPAPRLTTFDYLRMPETLLPQELVYGLVRDSPGPPPSHQAIVGEIYWKLRAHLERTRAGKAWVSPIDVVLDRERGLVVQPDLIVVMNDRLHIVTDRVWGAPDLVIEVLSPHLRIGRLEERIEWFAQYGVRECWTVLEGVRQIEVISFERGRVSQRDLVAPDERIRSSVLPDVGLTAVEIITAS